MSMNTGDLMPANEADEQHDARADRPSRARQALRWFDRYTLEVMNPGHPYRLPTDRSA
jgi:hypothetical protein